MMKVWITKYALSTGIYEIEAKEVGDGMVSYRVNSTFTSFAHGEGKEWHRDRESAVKRAEAMRDKKIVSLTKSIAKLQAMTF